MIITTEEVTAAHERLELVGRTMNRELGKQFYMPYKDEAVFQDKVQLFLTLLKPYAYKVRNEAEGIAGRPDIEVCFCGLFIGLELKDDIGKRSAVQEETARHIEEAQGYCKEVRTLNEVYETLIQALEEKYGVLFV